MKKDSNYKRPQENRSYTPNQLSHIMHNSIKNSLWTGFPFKLVSLLLLLISLPACSSKPKDPDADDKVKKG